MEAIFPKGHQNTKPSVKSDKTRKLIWTNQKKASTISKKTAMTPDMTCFWLIFHTWLFETHSSRCWDAGAVETSAWMVLLYDATMLFGAGFGVVLDSPSNYHSAPFDSKRECDQEKIHKNTQGDETLPGRRCLAFTQRAIQSSRSPGSSMEPWLQQLFSKGLNSQIMLVAVISKIHDSVCLIIHVLRSEKLLVSTCFNCHIPAHLSHTGTVKKHVGPPRCLGEEL